MKVSNNKGGMLLYTIIMTTVISFVCATLVAIGLNQVITSEMGCKRIEAIQLSRAGLEYIYDMLFSATPDELVAGGTINDDGDGTYSTSLAGYSNVSIEINPIGTDDPMGVNYRIEVITEY